MQDGSNPQKLMRVGELAKAVSKTVRAMHTCSPADQMYLELRRDRIPSKRILDLRRSRLLPPKLDSNCDRSQSD